MGRIKKTKEEFIENARKIHGDKYGYDNFVYVNNKTKGMVTCPIHGDFSVRPDKHLWQKRGCPKCNGGVRLTTDEFIKRAKYIHGDLYNYSNVVYKDAFTPVNIICRMHGEFWQVPYVHLNGHGCPKCGGSLPLNTEEFIKRCLIVHNEKYDYSKVDYKNNHIKVCIICPEHGEFWQAPHHHLNGIGCPYCKESHLERDTNIYLKSNSIVFDREKRFEWLGKQHLDFYLPDYNIAIECQGEQHYKPCTFGGISLERAEKNLIYVQELDLRKAMLCEENGVILEYINYDDTVEERLNEIFKKYDMGRT